MIKLSRQVVHEKLYSPPSYRAPVVLHHLTFTKQNNPILPHVKVTKFRQHIALSLLSH